mmetsp:Transcript_16227/g.49370  ORF Transcript_16227/g.49370 Transcript_16227/m.49370 type:complete len:230 (+) Transcript_16227:928-1617(+)
MGDHLRPFHRHLDYHLLLLANKESSQFEWAEGNLHAQRLVLGVWRGRFDLRLSVQDHGQRLLCMLDRPHRLSIVDVPDFLRVTNPVEGAPHAILLDVAFPHGLGHPAFAPVGIRRRGIQAKLQPTVLKRRQHVWLLTGTCFWAPLRGAGQCYFSCALSLGGLVGTCCAPIVRTDKHLSGERVPRLVYTGMAPWITPRCCYELGLPCNDPITPLSSILICGAFVPGQGRE